VTAIQSHRHLAAFAKFMLPRIPISYRPMQGAIALAETATALLQGKGAGSGWNMDAEIRAHRRFIRSQCPVLFDVGANVGEWSNAVTKRLGGNVQLWMFEPQEACREYLEPLVDRGVGICTSRVGDRDGFTDLFTPGGPSGIASLYPRRDTFFSDTQFAPQRVKIITIDGFMEQRGIQYVDFMKMILKVTSWRLSPGQPRRSRARRLVRSPSSSAPAMSIAAPISMTSGTCSVSMVIPSTASCHQVGHFGSSAMTKTWSISAASPTTLRRRSAEGCADGRLAADRDCTKRRHPHSDPRPAA
jgi:FkbM family methyltransferase